MDVEGERKEWWQRGGEGLTNFYYEVVVGNDFSEEGSEDIHSGRGVLNGQATILLAGKSLRWMEHV